MDLVPPLSLAIVLLVAVILALLYFFNRLKEELGGLRFAKQSQSVRYGKLTEQFMPFLRDFPHDASDFRFIGSPIDGLVFTPGKVVFCEFKTASSRLSDKQKRIKELVKKKAVEWLEWRIE